MKKTLNKRFKKGIKGNLLMGILTLLGVGLLVILAIGLSWLLTCGIVKLICLCFGLTFSWGVATGIWLVLGLLGSIFGGKKA